MELQQPYPQQQQMGQPYGQPMGQPMYAQVQPQPVQVQPTAPLDRRANFDLSIKPARHVGDVPSDDLFPCLGLGIATYSLYTDVPYCCGCAGKQTLLCMSNQQLTCKPVRDSDEVEACFVFNRTSLECVPSLSIFKTQTQCLCFDCRIAIPTGPQDYEHPAILNLFGFNCCFNCKGATGCCHKIDALRAQANKTAIVVK